MRLLQNSTNRLILTAFIVLAVDQCTKLYALHSLPIFDSPLIGLSLRINHGISFGMFEYFSGYAFILLSIVSLCIIGYSLPWKKNTVSNISFGMAIGGGIGNVIDRIIHGGVVDFIQVLNLFVCNFADIALTIAGICFVYIHLYKRKFF